VVAKFEWIGAGALKVTIESDSDNEQAPPTRTTVEVVLSAADVDRLREVLERGPEGKPHPREALDLERERLPRDLFQPEPRAWPPNMPE
jgi:hypothetical protein